MRTYSEQDVAAIIARAAERQAEAAREPLREGLTLDEIERLGADAGLDPDDLRAAAAEIDAAGRTLTRQASQTTTHVVVERWIDAPLTPEAWEDAVDGLREQLGLSAMAAFGGAAGGTAQQVGRAFEWTHTSGLGVQTVVTASPRGERTRLRMSQLVGLASPRAEGLMYGTALAALMTLAAGVALANVGVVGAVLAASLLAAFAAFVAIGAPATAALDRRWRSRKLAELDRLADDVALRLARPGLAPEPARDEPVAAPTRDAFDRLTDDSLTDGGLTDDTVRDAANDEPHSAGRTRARS